MSNIDKIVIDMRKYSEFFRCKTSKEARTTADNYIKMCIEEYIPEKIKEPYYKLWERMKK